MARSLTEIDEAITVSTTAIGFTKTTYDKVKGLGFIIGGCTMSVSTADIRIRYTDAGGANLPTTSLGVIIPAGTTLTFDTPEEVTRVMMIRDGAVDAEVFVIYTKI